MKIRHFALGLVVAIALSSCGLGRPAIVGKWKCVNPDGASANTFEYLADGTELQTFEYISKPSDMSDIEWDIKKDDKKNFNATWKILEGDRLQKTSEGKSVVFDYIIDGNSLEMNPPNGQKCDRLH